MEDEDLEIDDITENINKKKKIKSGRKGKQGERDIVHELNTRFAELFSKNTAWGQFSRSVGSGNRWGQNVCLPKHAKDTFTGDLVCPDKFKFVIESKAGYNDIDLFTIYTKCKELDVFIKQVTDDSVRSTRRPLLIWKKDRKGRIAFVKKEELTTLPNVYIMYNDWIGVSFSWLLQLPDSFFFD